MKVETKIRKIRKIKTKGKNTMLYR